MQDLFFMFFSHHTVALSTPGCIALQRNGSKLVVRVSGSAGSARATAALLAATLAA